LELVSLRYTDPSGLNPISGAIEGAELGTATCGPYCGIAGGIVGGMIGSAIGDAISDVVLQQEIEKAANRQQDHSRCDEPPPPGLDPCERAKWKLKKAKDCKALRQEFTNKWYNGQFDDDHAKHMEQLDNEMRNAERAIKHSCKNECEKGNSK
jgi:hypothetical protein